jgi:hypothetical protein
MWTERRTDRYDEADSRFSQFCEKNLKIERFNQMPQFSNKLTAVDSSVLKTRTGKVKDSRNSSGVAQRAPGDLGS